MKYMVGLLEKQLDSVDFPVFQIFLLNSKNTMRALIDTLNGAHSDDTYVSEVRLRILFSIFILLSQARLTRLGNSAGKVYGH